MESPDIDNSERIVVDDKTRFLKGVFVDQPEFQEELSYKEANSCESSRDSFIIKNFPS